MVFVFRNVARKKVNLEAADRHLQFWTDLDDSLRDRFDAVRRSLLSENDLTEDRSRNEPHQVNVLSSVHTF